MILRITLDYPKDEVERLVRFAATPYNLRGVVVNVKNCKHLYRGMAYFRSFDNAGKYHRVPINSVNIAIGKALDFPYTTDHYGGKKSPSLHFRNWQEALVALAAHEFHHIDQFQNNRPRYEWACERAAERALLRYRNEQR